MNLQTTLQHSSPEDASRFLAHALGLSEKERASVRSMMIAGDWENETLRQRIEAASLVAQDVLAWAERASSESRPPESPSGDPIAVMREAKELAAKQSTNPGGAHARES